MSQKPTKQKTPAIEQIPKLNLKHRARSPKNYLEEYLASNVKHELNLSGRQKQMLKDQERENMRLIRRISQIKHRRSDFLLSQDQQLHNNVYTLNLASRRLQRELREKSLQVENDIMVERIMKKRSQMGINGFGVSPENIIGKSRRKRKRGAKSVFLPKLDEYQGP